MRAVAIFCRHLACFIIADFVAGFSYLILDGLISVLFEQKNDTAFIVICFFVSCSFAILAYVKVYRTLKVYAPVASNVSKVKADS